MYIYICIYTFEWIWSLGYFRYMNEHTSTYEYIYTFEWIGALGNLRYMNNYEFI